MDKNVTNVTNIYRTPTQVIKKTSNIDSSNEMTSLSVICCYTTDKNGQ